MFGGSLSPSAPGLPIDELFRDVYRILEELKEAKQQIDSIAAVVVHCNRELLHLERIHSNKWRLHASDTEDPFDVREILNKFLISCNALTYVNSPVSDFDDLGEGCLFPSKSKRSWKKKHVKALEAEFAEHDRALSLALSNAVYTSALRIQRVSPASDALLTQVLRRSERRHNACEKADGAAPKNSQKDVDSQIEEMDWELCLRKFFDLLESSTWTNPEPEANPSLSRQSSFNRSDYIQPIKRSNTNSSVRSSYGEFRRGEELNTSQFYRPPRRRNSTASHCSGHEGDSDASSALVLYGSNQSQPASRALRRPVRRSSIAADFHWEYVGRSSTFEILAPLTSKWPELKDAQVDIYTQTEGMSATEARAYALGRLASLPAEMTDEVRRVLTQDTQNRGAPTRYSPTPARVEADLPRRSMSLEDLRRPTMAGHRASLSNAYMRARQAPEGPRPVQLKPAKEEKPAKNKGRFLDLRPLTAISERPSTSKSRNSSIDKGSGRSIMHPFIHRKSNLSAQVLETVMDTPKPEGRSSSGSDTLTSDKDFEMKPSKARAAEKRPPVPRSPVNMQKPLPPKPKTSRTRQSVMAFFRARSSGRDLRATLQPSSVSLASHLSASKSRESLGRVSMDLLKRKDSKVTLFSLAEGMDVPFDMWLKALPYIEGRCQTPKNI